jgi:hypothetical protein
LSELSVIIETLQELERIYQLNLEVLEQLNIICGWILKNDVAIPNKDKLDSMFLKTQALLKELYFSSPKTLHYRKLTDEKKQHFRTDEDVPVPLYIVLESACG